MNKNLFISAGLFVIVALILNFQLVLAHGSITVGDYTVEIGWLNEPPVAGQQNAIVVNVLTSSSGEPVEDVSSLTVTVSYGGQEKELTLQPLGEDTPGQFITPILPTIPGRYTILLGGQLGDTPVDAHIEPEEVQSADIMQFPSVSGSSQTAAPGATNGLTWLAVFLGLVGVGLGVAALRKAH